MQSTDRTYCLPPNSLVPTAWSASSLSPFVYFVYFVVNIPDRLPFESWSNSENHTVSLLPTPSPVQMPKTLVFLLLVLVLSASTQVAAQGDFPRFVDPHSAR